jgi:hypothetical protein
MVAKNLCVRTSCFHSTNSHLSFLSFIFISTVCFRFCLPFCSSGSFIWNMIIPTLEYQIWANIYCGSEKRIKISYSEMKRASAFITTFTSLLLPDPPMRSKNLPTLLRSLSILEFFSTFPLPSRTAKKRRPMRYSYLWFENWCHKPLTMCW